MERRSHRSSILKPKKETSEQQEVTEVFFKRRVSFAGSKYVKRFSAAHDDNNTIWDSTYEENMKTDSTHSSNEKSMIHSTTLYNVEDGIEQTEQSLIDYNKKGRTDYKSFSDTLKISFGIREYEVSGFKKIIPADGVASPDSIALNSHKQADPASSFILPASNVEVAEVTDDSMDLTENRNNILLMNQEDLIFPKQPKQIENKENVPITNIDVIQRDRSSESLMDFTCQNSKFLIRENHSTPTNLLMEVARQPFSNLSDMEVYRAYQAVAVNGTLAPINITNKIEQIQEPEPLEISMFNVDPGKSDMSIEDEHEIRCNKETTKPIGDQQEVSQQDNNQTRGQVVAGQDQHYKASIELKESQGAIRKRLNITNKMDLTIERSQSMAITCQTPYISMDKTRKMNTDLEQSSMEFTCQVPNIPVDVTKELDSDLEQSMEFTCQTPKIPVDVTDVEHSMEFTCQDPKIPDDVTKKIDLEQSTMEFTCQIPKIPVSVTKKKNSDVEPSMQFTCQIPRIPNDVTKKVKSDVEPSMEFTCQVSKIPVDVKKKVNSDLEQSMELSCHIPDVTVSDLENSKSICRSAGKSYNKTRTIAKNEGILNNLNRTNDKEEIKGKVLYREKVPHVTDLSEIKTPNISSVLLPTTSPCVDDTQQLIYATCSGDKTSSEESFALSKFSSKLTKVNDTLALMKHEKSLLEEATCSLVDSSTANENDSLHEQRMKEIDDNIDLLIAKARDPQQKPVVEFTKNKFDFVASQKKIKEQQKTILEKFNKIKFDRILEFPPNNFSPIKKENEAMSKNKGVKFNFYENIKELEKRSDGHWELLQKDPLKIRTCCLCLKLSVNFDPNSGLVHDFSIDDIPDKFHTGIMRLYMKMFKENFSKENLAAVLGTKYDVLSLLDFVPLTMRRLKAIGKQLRSNKVRYCKYIEVDENYRARYYFFYPEWFFNFIVSINLSDLGNISEECVTVVVEVGKIKPEEIKRLAENCPKGIQFVETFLDKIYQYLEKTYTKT